MTLYMHHVHTVKDREDVGHYNVFLYIDTYLDTYSYTLSIACTFVCVHFQINHYLLFSSRRDRDARMSSSASLS